MDVVALAQHGVENAVATLGTATTPVHVAKLLKMADNVVFCFDGDAAGRKAAWRALEVSLPVLADGKARELPLPSAGGRSRHVRAPPRQGRIRQGPRAGKAALAVPVRRARVARRHGDGRRSRELRGARQAAAGADRGAGAGRDAAQAPGRARAPLARGDRSAGARPGSPERRPAPPAQRAGRKGPRRPESRILAIVLHRTELAGQVPEDVLDGLRARSGRAPGAWSSSSTGIRA